MRHLLLSAMLLVASAAPAIASDDDLPAVAAEAGVDENDLAAAVTSVREVHPTVTPRVYLESVGELARPVPPFYIRPVWYRLGMCESSGDPYANTGNGFYGWFQDTHSTWVAAGGLKYAYNAHLATPEQQVEINEVVLAQQGPGAWPWCGRNLPLRR